MAQRTIISPGPEREVGQGQVVDNLTALLLGLPPLPQVAVVQDVGVQPRLVPFPAIQPVPGFGTTLPGPYQPPPAGIHVPAGTNPEVVENAVENLVQSPIRVHTIEEDVAIENIGHPETDRPGAGGLHEAENPHIYTPTKYIKVQVPVSSPGSPRSPALVVSPVGGVVEAGQTVKPITTPTILQASPETCCVCLTEEVSPGGLLQCKHPVCKSCVAMLHDPRCPLCRGPLIGGVATGEVVQQAVKRKAVSAEETARKERIRDEMTRRTVIPLFEKFYVDQFDAYEIVRQALRQYDPLEFTTEIERQPAVDIIVYEIKHRDTHGVNLDRVRTSVDKALTLTPADRRM